MEPSAPHPVRNGSGRAGPILFFIILGLIVAAILAFILFHPRPNGSSTLTGPDAHSASPADAATIHRVLTAAASRDDTVARSLGVFIGQPRRA